MTIHKPTWPSEFWRLQQADRTAALIDAGNDASVTSKPPVVYKYNAARKVIGLLEATILLGSIIVGIVYPDLLMLIVIAAAGFAAAALALLDDRLVARAAATRASDSR